jgi:hypothetical protein
VKIRPWGLVLTAIAVSVGLITLLGYFVNVPILLALRLQFVAWASILAAVVVGVGALNLLGVHLKKISDQSGGWLYSIFLVLSLLGVIGASMVAPFLNMGSGPTNQLNTLVFKYLVSALGTAISGLLIFFLVFAGYRLLRRRSSVATVTFLVVAFIALLGMAPQLPELPLGDLGFRNLWIWLSQVPAVAGARGVLLGIALGVVATGLRILLAVDRPYGE